MFPDLMKHSKGISLFKSGDMSDLPKFWLVSILPILSKNFEKIMLWQMMEHFNKHKLKP